MLKVTLLSCLLAGLGLLGSQVYSAEFEREFGSVDDEFKAANINEHALKVIPWKERESEIEKLENLMKDRTDSTDPDVNLDIIQVQLDLETRNKVSPQSRSNQAKRLLLALRTLKGENECNYYGYKIITKNFALINPSLDAIMEDTSDRRVDKIMAHYVKSHINNCRDVYFRKFDEITPNLDKNLVEKMDTFVERAMEDVIQEFNQKFPGKTNVEALFEIANKGFSTLHMMKPSYIYNVMQISAKHDPDVGFLKPIEDEITGISSVRRDKFFELFDNYIAKPCNHFRQQLGPDVFQPILFDSMFKHQIKEDRVDFYQAWVKYGLCYLDGSSKRVLDAVVEFAETGQE